MTIHRPLHRIRPHNTTVIASTVAFVAVAATLFLGLASQDPLELWYVDAHSAPDGGFNDWGLHLGCSSGGTYLLWDRPPT